MSQRMKPVRVLTPEEARQTRIRVTNTPAGHWFVHVASKLADAAKKKADAA